MTGQRREAGDRQRLVVRQLLDFARAPGRYAIRLGEPQTLFQEFDTVVRWAHGRLPEDLADDANELDAPALARAAVLFIQRACFGRGCTHYQVLGLTQETFTAERLRAHYRMLIRLTHPDIGVRGLPSNAAGMVNRAYDVLNDDAARLRYDQKLAAWGDAPALRPRKRSGSGTSGDSVPPAPGATSHRAAHQLATRQPLVPAFRIDRRPPLRERCSSWIAGYPRQIRSMLVLGCVLLVLGGVVAWSALETMEGGRKVLVAAQPAPLEEAAPVATLPKASVGARGTGAAMAIISRPDAMPQTPETTTDAIALAAVEGGAPLVPPQPVTARLETTPAEPDPGSPIPAATGRDIETRATAPARERAEPARAAKQPPPRSAQSASKPDSRTGARTGTASQTADRTGAATAAVDTRGARDYLDGIVVALRQAHETEQLNRYLTQMNVRGSLLTPVLELQLDAPRLSVRHTGWDEAHRPGALSMRSVLMLEVPGADAGISVYRLVADFRGTAQGTVLERLDLQRVR